MVSRTGVKKPTSTSRDRSLHNRRKKVSKKAGSNVSPKEVNDDSTQLTNSTSGTDATPGTARGNLVENMNHGEQIATESRAVHSRTGTLSHSDRTSSQPLNDIDSSDQNVDHINNEEYELNIRSSLNDMERGELEVDSNERTNSENHVSTERRNDAERLPSSNLQERRRSKGTEAQRNNLEEGTRNNSRRNVSPSSLNVRDASNGSSIEQAYNECKAQLRDANRDKRVFAACYETEKAKNDELQKEKANLSQRVLALETIISKKGKTYNKKGSRWSNDSAKKPAKERYHGVFMSLLHYMNKSANLCVTESYVDEDTGCRLRNWTGIASRVSPQTAQKTKIYVYLPGGAHGIPHCSMEVALNREFYTLPFENVPKYMQHRTKRLLESRGFSFMSPTTKDDCMNIMISDRELISRHRTSLSEAVSKRKKHAKISFLKVLGYNTVCKPVPAKKEDPDENLRRSERNEIQTRCVLKEDGRINTMYWRISKWSEICKFDLDCPQLVKEMRIGDANANSDGNVDILFANHAARLACMELRGYEILSMGPLGCKDVSIVTIARADAWMTTLLDNITLEGRRGKRNNQFTDGFQNLVPTALDAIIMEIWNDISELAPDELSPNVCNSKDDANDPYGNYIRDHTVGIHSDRENYLYLLASPTYIKENICSWFGIVKDCYIGRCKLGQNDFVRITSSMTFQAEDCEEDEAGSTAAEYS